MDKSKILSSFKINTSKMDYTFGVLFLLISSFFLFFVVRPVLSIAISLNREKNDLQKVEKQLHENFLRSIALKNDLESIRGDLGVLGNALPTRPRLDGSIDLIKQVANDANIVINTLDVERVKFVKDTKIASEESYLLRIQFTSEGENIRNLVNGLNNYQRILTIKNIKLRNVAKPTKMSANILVEVPTFW